MTVDIQQRVSKDGHPFSEVLFCFEENGKEQYACTRYWFVVIDTPHNRENEKQQFLKRRARQ